MGLIETLMFELAPSVSKLLFKYWCNDAVADIGADLVRVVGGKTKDVMIQNRVRRQIEEIGERVTENLIPFFEAKEGCISEMDKTALIVWLKNVIGSANLSADVVVEYDLDPSKLAKYLILSNPNVERYLVTAEMRSLFKDILNEVSQNVVDIASQFPAFTEKGLSELLKRDTMLLQITTDILTEVRSIREGSRLANAEETFAVFEAEYRRAVVRKLDVIQLFGTTLSEASKRHRLSVAYITLSVEEIDSNTTKGINRDYEVEAKPVGQAISGKRLVVITGIAGSGKTTLLQWLSVNCARKAHTENLEQLNDLIPFFIRLRQCVDGQFPAPELFPTFVAPNITGTMPPTWVHRLLEQGRALVLIDGIDEIATEFRASAREWIEDLCATYPSSYFYVTSRPHAVEDAWLDRKQFYTAELTPMDLPDILSFVEHWHDSVRETLQEDEERADVEQLEVCLKLMLRSNRSLLNLATNPLLCSMICALNRDRQQHLPSDRIELYSACIELLLERRDVERRVVLTDYPKIGLRAKTALLEQLGYWLIRNEVSMTSKEKIVEYLAGILANFPSFPVSTTASQIIKLFVERAGMLREPITGQIDFTHRTFQEFFAAKAALNNEDVGLLIKNAHEDQWREVVVLAAGRGSKRQSEEIVVGLIERGDRETAMRHQLHLMAVECLSSTVELSSDTMNQVKIRLKKLIPKNIGEAKAIASAGDLAVPYLSNKDRLSTTAIACVRALALIGTDASMQALKTYAGESRKTVVKEIVKAARLFDEVEFSTLAKTFGVKVLSFDSIDSIIPISSITALRALYIYNCSRVCDLGPLTTLQNIKKLNLCVAPKIQSLAPLKHLSGLSELALFHFPKLTTITDISELKTLSHLRLTMMPAIKDLTPLSNLSSLSSLKIGDCPSVDNLDFIRCLNKLTQLHLSSLKNVVDFTFLKDNTNIQHLELKDLSAPFDVGLLSANNALTGLSLIELNMIELHRFQTLPNLRRLSLCNIKSLKRLPLLPPSLTEITIINCDFDDISELQHATNLRNVILIDCKFVKDITVLKELSELRSFTIRGNFLDVIKAQTEEVRVEHKGIVRFTANFWKFAGSAFKQT